MAKPIIAAFVASAIALSVSTAVVSEACARVEADYRDQLCAGMEMEVGLPNGTRVDCISDTHAIEVDYSDKWAEALGQALSYAASTDKQPGIFLICRRSAGTCLAHALRLEEAIAFWNLPVTVWRVPGEGS